MLASISKIKKLFLDILFPDICFSCRRLLSENHSVLCPDCLNSIVVNRTLLCPTCGGRLPNNQPFCHRSEPFLLGSALSFHNFAVRQLIHAFKFSRLESAGNLLGSFLVTYAKNLDFNFSGYTLVPVPLSPRRKRQRGFNQSALLTHQLSSSFNLLVKSILCRSRHTRPQSELKGSERLANISGCFTIANPNLVTPKNIILIDDVFTSGATAREAVKTLKAAGAHKVLVLTAAKT